MPTKKIVLSREPVMLAILQNSFFQREGFEMISVQDGQTGFEVVEAEAPALAVFDIAELGIQALACCRSIKQDPLLTTTPVLLILPNNAEENLADQCWDAGCDAVVHRPLDAERFLEAACGLLGIPRRLVRRFPVSFPLEFVDDKLNKYSGSCINLNSGGMFVVTETLYPVDSRLTVEFSLPGLHGLLRHSVRVAWVNHPEWLKKNAFPCGMGLQFINETAEFRDALKNCINSYAAD